MTGSDDADLAFDRVALTGTPGTGKTTVADAVGERLISRSTTSTT